MIKTNSSIDIFPDLHTIKQMSCLILDKSPQIRESLSHLLLVLGIKGVPVGSRHEGLVVLDKDNEIDTAIVDVDNQDTEGLELIQEIKNSDKIKKMTIIIHSAQSSREFVTKTMEMGIQGYLLKPFQEDKTFQRLKNILVDQPDQQTEKRQHIRVNPDPGELLRLHFRIPGHDKLVSGRIRNISMGGVALELHSAIDAELLKPGSPIPKLQFVLMSKPLAPSGLVVLNKQKIIAVRFGVLSKDERTIIARYIYRIISS